MRPEILDLEPALREQIRRHRPSMVSVAASEHAAELGREFPDLTVCSGDAGLVEVACCPGSDMLVGAVVACTEAVCSPMRIL